MSNKYPITNSDFMSPRQRNSLRDEYLLSPVQDETEEALLLAEFNLIVADKDEEAVGDIEANIHQEALKYVTMNSWLILKRRFIIMRMWEENNQIDEAQQQREEYRATLENVRLNAEIQYENSIQNKGGKKTSFFITPASPTVIK